MEMKTLKNFAFIGGFILVGILLFGLMQKGTSPVGQVHSYAGQQCVEYDTWTSLQFDVSSLQGQNVDIKIEQGLCGDICGSVVLDSVCLRETCPKDADGDGVSDAFDSCPATTPSTIVDSAGCHYVPISIDNDNDGVDDAFDTCSGSGMNDVVGYDGCTIADGIEAAQYQFEGNHEDSIRGLHGRGEGKSVFSPGVLGKGWNMSEGVMRIDDTYHLRSQDFSISFWLKDVVSPFEPKYIITKRDGYIDGYDLTIQPDSSMELCFSGDCVFTQPIVDEKQHHYTITYDGNPLTNNGDVLIYKDGVVILGPEVKPYFPSFEEIIVNRDGINGVIDELRFFNTALSFSQVLEYCKSEGGCSLSDSDFDSIPNDEDSCPDDPYDDCLSPDLYTETMPNYNGHRVWVYENEVYISFTYSNLNTLPTTKWFFTPLVMAGDQVYEAEPQPFQSIGQYEEHTMTYQFAGPVDRISMVYPSLHTIDENPTSQYIADYELIFRGDLSE